MKILTTGVGLVLALAVLVAASGTQYRFSSSGNYPGAVYTIPIALNSRQIVGYYVTVASGGSYVETLTGVKGARHFLTITPPGSGTSYASGINAQGVIVGWYCIGGCNPYPAAEHGYTWDQGKFTTIDYPGAMSTGVYGINDFGQIVGGFCPYSILCADDDGNPSQHAFIEDHGVFTQLDFPGAFVTQANAINDAGQIVGTYETLQGLYSFLYQNGEYTRIAVPHAVRTFATAINNRGVVAGSYEGGYITSHSFLYQNGEFTTVDFPGRRATAISGINDAGIIIGNWAPSVGFDLTFKGVPISQPTP